MHRISLPLKIIPLGRWFFCLLLALVNYPIADAQPQYQFDHWTTDDGLPQNAVNAILQTRDGYLWLATYDALSCVSTP